MVYMMDVVAGDHTLDSRLPKITKSHIFPYVTNFFIHQRDRITKQKEFVQS